MHKILLVEDDATINQLVKKNLEEWGCEVTDVMDFTQVLQEFIRTQPHLVLLDLTLPFFNGYFWCQEIRKISQAPIIFLSSHDQAMDIVMAINMGADDYVTKPFEMSILLAKVQGILRRSYEFGKEIDASIVEYQGIVLDLKKAQLHFQGQDVDLTRNEFQILQVLLNQGARVVSRESLMHSLWQSDLFIDDNTLTVNVTRLRKKLADIGLGHLIVTKKGLGYCLGEVEKR